MAGELSRIVLIEELDTCNPEIFLDKDSTVWGIIEIGGKTYKVNMKDFVAMSEGNDPRVPGLIQKVEDLTKLVKTLVSGLDENKILED